MNNFCHIFFSESFERRLHTSGHSPFNVCMYVLGTETVCVLSRVLTLCNSIDCSLPGSSVHRILQARLLEWVCHFLLQGIFPTQELNLCLLHWQADSLPLPHLGTKLQCSNSYPLFQFCQLIMSFTGFPHGSTVKTLPAVQELEMHWWLSG